eukprot:TRINITY_DN6412_c0_g2_i1.p1 TRINITY_DN6412_c0_g2~~TRINITY_DN6412_c0_g2_i1.p1  ORF type:complete len:577 (-),score=131.74 TRINITY_DN6412_c0_g2_i1:88-1818(-)
MKSETIMILWHSKDPVFSVDFHSSGRLVTGGADNDVKIWRIIRNNTNNNVTNNEHTTEATSSTSVTKNKHKEYHSIEFLANLSRHSKAVNSVRFSPSGEFLASGGDDGFIFIWKLNEGAAPNPDSIDKESWSIVYTLRGQPLDVYDLCWSHDSKYLASGSTDNSAAVWSLNKTGTRQILTDHTHYVQGVAFDPLGVYLATFSSDRSCKLYTSKKQKSKKSSKGNASLLICKHTLTKRYYKKEEVDESNTTVTTDEKGKTKEKEKEKHKLFLDENMNTFFRRLCWSPDGALLFTPAGMFKANKDSGATNASYIFSRPGSNPTSIAPNLLVHLPSTKPVIVIRCNPCLFKLKDSTNSTANSINSNSKDTTNNSNNSVRDEDTKMEDVEDSEKGNSQQGVDNEHPNSFFKLSYRIVFAVATLDTVVIYDTQHAHPLCYVTDIHYAALTDLAWSKDGRTLVVSSKDGYCSIISFEENELGVPLSSEEFSRILKEERGKEGDLDIAFDIDGNEPTADEESKENKDKDNKNKEKEKDEAAKNLSATKKDTDTPPLKKPRRVVPTLISTPNSKPTPAPNNPQV